MVVTSSKRHASRENFVRRDLLDLNLLSLVAPLSLEKAKSVWAESATAYWVWAELARVEILASEEWLGRNMGASGGGPKLFGNGYFRSIALKAGGNCAFRAAMMFQNLSIVNKQLLTIGFF
jgi:hypothetical protein